MNIVEAVKVVDAGKRVRRVDWNASFLVSEDGVIMWVQPPIQRLAPAPPAPKGKDEKKDEPAEPVLVTLKQRSEKWAPTLADIRGDWWVLP